LYFCRFACPGEGLPPDIVQDMFSNSRWSTHEGIGLSTCRKILKLMGGEVQYIRESERSFFLIMLELPQPQPAARRASVDM
jgi:phytochrome B